MASELSIYFYLAFLKALSHGAFLSPPLHWLFVLLSPFISPDSFQSLCVFSLGISSRKCLPALFKSPCLFFHLECFLATSQFSAFNASSLFLNKGFFLSYTLTLTYYVNSESSFIDYSWTYFPVSMCKIAAFFSELLIIFLSSLYNTDIDSPWSAISEVSGRRIGISMWVGRKRIDAWLNFKVHF